MPPLLRHLGVAAGLSRSGHCNCRDIVGGAERNCRRAGSDPLDQAGQHLAAADLDETGRRRPRPWPARIRASAPCRSPARPARRGSRRDRSAARRRHWPPPARPARSASTLAKRLAHGIGGRLHQRAMEGRRHRQRQGALDAALALASAIARSIAALVPEITTWPAAIVVGDLADLALRRLGRELARLVEIEHRAAPPWRPARPAPPSASPGRACAAAAPHRQIEKLPAAASAEYSPSEWPATKAASRLQRRDRPRPPAPGSRRG